MKQQMNPSLLGCDELNLEYSTRENDKRMKFQLNSETIKEMTLGNDTWK